jgi:hypothetical protein
MKKILVIVILTLFCFSLVSCSVIEALKDSISGDIIDPADNFSRGAEKGTLIYKNNNYILVQELGGYCEIDITQDDILLGQTSNFPFFPNSYYYVNPGENPSFIMGGTSAGVIGSFVYLREDLYNAGVVYEINDSFEFEFTSAFMITDKVDYDHHITREKYTRQAKVDFYVKDIPTILACKRIYLIDNTWYCVEVDVAYQLSDEFVYQLTEEGIIN